MADNVKVEVDLVTGKLSLECPEASVEPILSRLAEFLPKLRDHAEPGSRHPVSHPPAPHTEQPESKRQANPPNGSAEGGRKRGAAALRAPGALDTRQEVQNLQLNVDEPGLLAWGSLGKDWKKYLWILEAARKRKIDGLSNSEISYLMDKTFRESRAPKVVNNIKQKIKDRFVQPINVTAEGKTYSVWRILADGSKEVVEAGGAAKA